MDAYRRFVISTTRMRNHGIKHFVSFQALETDMLAFVRDELKSLKRVMSSHSEDLLESWDEEKIDGEEEEQRMESREAFVKIALHFMRRMKQEKLADELQNGKTDSF